MPAALPQWSGQGAAPGGGGAQCPRVGVSLEPLLEAAQKEGERLGSREDFARRVAMDLFRFLESFAGDQGQMAVPAPDRSRLASPYVIYLPVYLPLTPP